MITKKNRLILGMFNNSDQAGTLVFSSHQIRSSGTIRKAYCTDLTCCSFYSNYILANHHHHKLYVLGLLQFKITSEIMN
jgi:hypothetical protein